MLSPRHPNLLELHPADDKKALALTSRAFRETFTALDQVVTVLCKEDVVAFFSTAGLS